jgi:phosphate transport system substrate-binding protein
VETINAAGATFPTPIYQKWFFEVYKQNPNIRINYQSIGSGGGIRQLMQGTVDFGASDRPMSDQQLARFKNLRVLHFPSVLGAVVPVINIPGIEHPLKFTGATLAGVFLGTIRHWNDAALKADNPEVDLPDSNIVVVHRSDGSGTTFVWTDYLAKVSPEWKSRAGSGTSVNWPVGLGGKGNEGVTGLVQQTPNSIGYVELVYAVHSSMNYGLVKNADGNFVKADLHSVSAAAAGAAENMPSDFRVSITNAPGKNAYPISTFTWLLIPSKIGVTEKKSAIKEFLHWMITTGQSYTAALSYAPLPQAVVGEEAKQIALIE